jgi:hypothetical protein
MYSGRLWCREEGEPKAWYIQENAKTLKGGLVYPTIYLPYLERCPLTFYTLEEMLNRRIVKAK